MAFTYSLVAILILNYIIGSNGASNFTNPTSAPFKPILDPKRRNDLVDEAFLEQKDILLDMLEAKLKEVRDKKRKKSDRGQQNMIVDTKCHLPPNNVDVSLKGNGIVAVGEADVRLKFGEFGNSTINLNATGISNVGRSNLELGIGDGTIDIPGLNNLFIGSSVLGNLCNKQRKDDTDNNNTKDKVNLDDLSQFRRSNELNTLVSEKTNDTLDTETTRSSQDGNVTEEITTAGSTSPDYQDYDRREK